MPIDHRGCAARRGSLITTFAVVCLLLTPTMGASQSPAAGQTAASPAAQPITSVAGVEPSGERATLTFRNRPITVLRARVLGRSPSERVAATVRILDELVRQGTIGPVEVRVNRG